MALSDLLERLGRAVFEAPFRAAEDAPELAEIRLAVLDEIRAKSRRVAGRELFPYNVVTVHLRGIPEQQTAAFEGRFFTEFLEQELKGGLSRANCRFPAELRVEVETSPELPGDNEPWFRVQSEFRAKAGHSAAVRPARLVVLKGKAEPMELVLGKARANLGRTVEIYRAEGPSRRNDVAFREDNEIGRTVSREHAHIVFNRKAREYRLFNDRYYKTGNCGLWIIRDGLSQAVHRNARGVRLEPGDEIQLGRAVVRFQ